MCKKIIFIISALICGLLASCDSRDNVTEEITSSMDEVRFTVEDFIAEDGSRTNITTSGQFTWAEGDTLGIFPEEGYQTAFPISAGSGTATALFDGGQWALRKNARYAAYFPFLHPMDQIQKTAIPVSYLGQVQNGNNSTAHLGNYDYIASTFTTVSETGTTQFQLSHLSALVRFSLKVPEAASFNKMSITVSSGAFAETAKYSLISSAPTLTPKSTNQTIELGLTNIITTAADENITLYMFMAPGDYKNKSWTIEVGATNMFLSMTTPGKNLIAGKGYNVSGTLQKVVTDHNGHSFVNLGLTSGTLWATCNIGASTPDEFGDYYAWGESTTKSDYSKNTYLYWHPATGSTVDANGTNPAVPAHYDDLGNICGTQYDVAKAEWGSGWCIPTRDQFAELVQECDWTWTQENGVNGYRVSSKIDATKSIFLPAAGYYFGTWCSASGSEGYYWTSVPYNTEESICLYFRSGAKNVDNNCVRYYGRSVRPVRN